MKLHILPLSRSHQSSVGETADLRCVLLIFPLRARLCIRLHLFYLEPQRALPTYTCTGSYQVGAHASCFACVLWSAGGGGAAERADEHRGEGAAAPADVTASQGKHTGGDVALAYVHADILSAPTSACNFISEAARRFWQTSGFSQQLSVSTVICSTSFFCPIRPFSPCTTPWPRRTLTPCCRRCRTTSRTSWRKSR